MASTVHGDLRLGDKFLSHLGRRHAKAGIAAVIDGQIRVATIDCDINSDFEIGSVSKALTGMLFADAVSRGEVQPETRLGELLELGDSPAAGITLDALSTHTSGLPKLAPGTSPLKRSWEVLTAGRNPYRESVAQLVELARSAKLSSPKPRYSNFGYQLLGHAVAKAAGLPYDELLRTRLSKPLKMRGMYAPSTAAQLRPTALPGMSRTGVERDPWLGDGLAPAGGIRAGVNDLGRLLAAIIDGSAPGIDALEPVREFRGPKVRIGRAWLILESRGETITWHNGGTGGFRSWIGINRQGDAGVAVLSAFGKSVDAPGFIMLNAIQRDRD